MAFTTNGTLLAAVKSGDRVVITGAVLGAYDMQSSFGFYVKMPVFVAYTVWPEGGDYGDD